MRTWIGFSSAFFKLEKLSETTTPSSAGKFTSYAFDPTSPAARLGAPWNDEEAEPWPSKITFLTGVPFNIPFVVS